jgi:copper transport protein
VTRRWLRRRFLICFASLAAFAMLSSDRLSAHAALLVSDPAAGATLGDSPETIRLVFSEAVEPSLSDIRISDTRGASHQLERLQRVTGDPLAFSVRVARLERGIYIVNWRIVSAVDGHATTGAFAFGVRMDPGAAASASSSASVSWIEMCARWLFTAGLVLLIGAVFGALLRFAGPAELALPVWGWVVASAGVVLLLAAQRRASTAPIGTLFNTFIGKALIWRAVSLAAVGVSLLAARASSPRIRRIAMGGAAVAALACAGVHVAAGHAATPGLLPPPATVLVQWTHVAAIGIWLGGLAALLLGCRGRPSESKAAAVRRFSAVAAAGLLVVLASGALRTLGELTAWNDLFATTYGRMISIKIVLTAAIAALGGINRWRSVAAAPTSLASLRRFGVGELTLAAAALGAAAVLATVAPPAAAERSSSGLVVSGADYGTTVRVKLTAASDQPGPNRYRVQIADYDSKRRVDAKRVTLRFVPIEDPSSAQTWLALTPGNDGSFVGAGPNLAFDGRWRVYVLIERGDGSVEVPLEIETRRVEQSVSIARIPGQAPTYTVEVKRAGLVRISPVPESAGASTLYVTCYTILSDEVAVEWITVATETEDGVRRQWPVQRLTGSRFTATANLAHGLNRITVIARTVGGVRMRATTELRALP